MWPVIRMLPLLALPVVAVAAPAPAQTATAASGWTLGNIRVQGLVRQTAISVTEQLPFAPGQTIDDEQIAQAIKSLYASENYDDIQAEREGNTLVFKVVERPRIGRISYKGNRQIPSDLLTKGLNNVGLKEGEPLKRAALQGVINELESQYAQQGRYDAKVEVIQTPRPGNQVDLEFRLVEGSPAKVAEVRIIGNSVFKSKQIEQAFDVKSSSWRTLLNRKDTYSREKLVSSLENLRTMYLNRGYINFAINNSQVNLSEDKKRVFVEVNVSEGEVYKFGKVNFIGEPLYGDSELRKLVTIKPGTTYAQSRVTNTTDLLKRKYGNNGYYFANLQVIPEVDEKTRTINLTYLINPGKPVYVRRINFSGNQKTEDQVLRREMRQLEGALASSERLDLSKLRLERTGYFKTVALETVPVPNSPDQVDVNVRVEEQPSGSTTLAVGYSQAGGITFQAGLSQTNFLGTGNSVNIDLSRSQTLDNYNISFLNPYFTVDGISRGYNLYYRKTKINEGAVPQKYTTDSYGGAITFGYPLNENSSISATLSADNTTVNSGTYFSQYARDYLVKNGGEVISQTPYYLDTQNNFVPGDSIVANPDGTYAYYRDATGKIVASNTTGATAYPATRQSLSSYRGDFTTYNLNLAWGYSTLNRPIFATRGQSHRMGLEIALPGSDIEYQRLTYDGQFLKPLNDRYGMRFYTRLGYGRDLPFYKNFYAGGTGSVRGYRTATIGPRSLPYFEADRGLTLANYPSDPTFLEAVGGNALIQGGAELYFPLPGSASTQQIRPVIFAEGAQVFNTDSADFGYSANNFRYSVGVGFTWLTALGPLSLSYAVPLKTTIYDEEQRVQFEIGRVF